MTKEKALEILEYGGVGYTLEEKEEAMALIKEQLNISEKYPEKAVADISPQQDSKINKFHRIEKIEIKGESNIYTFELPKAILLPEESTEWREIDMIYFFLLSILNCKMSISQRGAKNEND